MIRVLTIVAAVTALAVSAAPVASAAFPYKLEECMVSGVKTAPPKPRCLDIGTAERLDLNARSTAKRRGAGKVANLGAADDVSTLKTRTSRAVVVLIGANDYGLVADRP